MDLHLSKSKYCQGVQCPKLLWLRENKPDQFDKSVYNEEILARGNEIGDLAMGLFGEFTEVPYGDLSNMIELTKSLIDAKTRVITEASFSFDSCFCSVDILVNAGEDSFELYEVKSSTKDKDIYHHDIAYQVYVLENLGYKVSKASLVHINAGYVREGELDIKQLFAITDLTDTVREMQDDVKNRIIFLREYTNSAEEPDCSIGTYCFSPYECGFWKYCTCNLPSPNVFDLSGMLGKTKMKLFNNGFVSFDDLLKNDKLTKSVKLQIEHETNALEPHIEIKPIREFISELSYPMYFLDFESFMPAIPKYDGTRPYEQIVFQYSLHYIENEGGELKHKEYLATPGDNPRKGVAMKLCEDIPKDACVIAYNMTFEKTRIKQLAALYPEYSEHLMNIHDNIKDLMIPFKDKTYYCKEMQGSYSIKYVLPALYPDDPELNYSNLEGVHMGTEASDAFERMEKMNPEEIEVCRKQLLAYCSLDTLAMVKIWQKLREI